MARGRKPNAIPTVPVTMSMPLHWVLALRKLAGEEHGDEREAFGYVRKATERFLADRGLVAKPLVRERALAFVQCPPIRVRGER